MNVNMILMLVCLQLVFPKTKTLENSGIEDIRFLHIGKTSLEEYIQQSWQIFVESMSTGIPDLNIPTFDPWFSNDSFPFKMQDTTIALKADVNATAVESLGFSSVQIPSIQESANSLYNVSLTLSDLKISGIYSVVGSHHYFYPVLGNGPFDVTLRGVWSSGTTTLLFNGTIYSLTQLELTPLTYGTDASEYFGLTVSGADPTSDTYTLIVHLLTELLWGRVEEQLRLQLSDSITDYLNDQLLDFNPSSFISKRKFFK